MAVDLFLGHQLRVHDDTEVAIAREDQHLLRKLDGIERIDLLENGIAKPWQDQPPNLPSHQLQCYFGTGETLEVLLNEFNEDHWLYRRDLR